MSTAIWRVAAATMLAVVTLTSCGTATRAQSDDPGDTSRASSAEVPVPGQRRHSDADVRFMQGMIPHHAQALVMTRLVSDRTDDAGIRLLARRIEVSQEDEIAMLQRWLRDRDEDVPSAEPHHAHATPGQHVHMAGMLSDEQIAELAEARGADFDRLFLEFMIMHHEGALVMVAELLDSAGAAQEADTFEIVSHIDADQRMEIERVRSMLSGR